MAPRTKSVPLTPEQLQLEKDVKRINERINEIAKMYGTDSVAYNKWYAAVKSMIPERYRRTSKDGIIQLARSKEFYKTAGTEQTKAAVNRILGLKTRGQLRKEARRSLKEEGVKNPSARQVTERQKDIDAVQGFSEDNPDMFYNPEEAAQKLIHIRGRRKTYQEMIIIADLYREATGQGQIIEQDLFEGLE